MTKQLNNDKPLVFLGDIHGNWNQLFYTIRVKHLANCNIVSVGDLGIGFASKKENELLLAKKLNDVFEENNINFYGIRGNHDNPLFFCGKERINLSHFQLVEDYSVFEYNNKTIQLIGGAISIDRTARQKEISYWSNEGVVFEKNKLQKVDVLVTHTAPSWCSPQKFNELVYGWAKEDACLIADLKEERSIMDQIFNICQPSFHAYGHFHHSWMEEINGCCHKLLDIEEMYEHRIL